MARSIVYSNIHLYRIAMNALYRGGYRRRFDRICELLSDNAQTVCEMCFGDTVIADWCRSHGVDWTGYDINRGFCERARRLGHDARVGNILEVDLPDADVYVMAGSLYHFHDRLAELFDRIFHHSHRFILSEPVHNLSNAGGPLGLIARRSANPGTGDAAFRFDQASLMEALQEAGRRKGFEPRIVDSGRDLVVDMVVR